MFTGASGCALLYYLYEMNHAALAPWRHGRRRPQFAEPGKSAVLHADRPPWAASARTVRYLPPTASRSLVTTDVIVDDDPAVEENIVFSKPFCKLLNFAKLRDV